MFERATPHFLDLILLVKILVLVKIGVLVYFSPHTVAHFWDRRLGG